MLQFGYKVSAFPSGDVSGRFRRPSPPPIPLRRRFRLFSSPVTSTHPSPATFKAFFVARHLHPSLSGDVSGHFCCPSPPPYLSGNVSGRFRCPSPPASLSGNVSGHFRHPSPPPIPLRQRFGAFPSPVTSAIPLRRRLRLFSSPVTSARTSPATFHAIIVT